MNTVAACIIILIWIVFEIYVHVNHYTFENGKKNLKKDARVTSFHTEKTLSRLETVVKFSDGFVLTTYYSHKKNYGTYKTYTVDKEVREKILVKAIAVHTKFAEKTCRAAA